MPKLHFVVQKMDVLQSFLLVNWKVAVYYGANDFKRVAAMVTWLLVLLVACGENYCKLY